MLRVRFRANIEDPRPIKWPVKHPYWVTGRVQWATKRTAYATVVSYADDEEYIYKNWPEASHLNSREVDDYQFTDRFPPPDWWPAEDQESQSSQKQQVDRLRSRWTKVRWSDDKQAILDAGDALSNALEALRKELERLKAAGYHLAISDYSDVALKELGATLDHDEGKLVLAALEEQEAQDE